MKNRGIISLLLVLILCCTMFCIPAEAADNSQSYTFAIVSDKASVTVGETVTLTVQLKENSKSSFYMYAVSAGVRFNAKMFELVSYKAGDGVNASVDELSGAWNGWNGIKMNALCSEYEGDIWTSPYQMLTIELKALSPGGSAVAVYDTEISNFDASDSYASEDGSIWLNVKNTSAGDSDAQGSKSDSSGGSDNKGSSSSGSSSSGISGGAADKNTGSSQSSGSGTGSVPGNNKYKNQFSDVSESSWYADAVKYVINADLYNGTSDTTFSPENTMTRGMFVTVLYRYAGTPAVSSSPGFNDTVSGSWYSDAVSWAKEKKIVSGYGDGSFKPERSITLEQMITVIARYKGAAGTGNIPAAYGRISKWAESSMSWADSVKLFTGVGGTLSAQKSATRAQVAAFMMNLDKSGK